MSVGLGCRRGGSHSKATAVVYISGLISPEKKQNISEQTVNLRHLTLRFFPNSSRSSLWQGSGMTGCAENLN